jgi:predicted RNA-binding protein with RPS1 domain
MVHVSELAAGFVKSPADVVKLDQEVEVRVIKLNRKKRQIDLSMKEAVPSKTQAVPEEQIEVPTAMALALQKAMSSDDDKSAAEKRKSRDAKAKHRDEQEEIINRTLRHMSN